MFKIFNTYNKFAKEFTPSLLNLTLIQSIAITSHELDADAPIGTQTILMFEDGYGWCSQSLSELNTLLNGH